MRTARSARLVVALVLASLVLGGASAASGRDVLVSFVMPSHRIGCMDTDGGGTPTFLRCDVLDVDHPAARPASCKLDYGHAFGLTARGRARRLCVGDTAVDPRAKVLAYGRSRRLGPFRCTSRRTGLRCTNAAGHGFALSRAQQRLF